MKKLRIVLAITIVLSLSLSAAAQTRVLAKADIPFQFSVHDQTFTAGVYEIRQIGEGVLRLVSATDHRGATIFSGTTIRQSNGLKLVFHQYGTDRFLREIADPALGFSANIAQSNSERAASRRQPKGTVFALKSSK